MRVHKELHGLGELITTTYFMNPYTQGEDINNEFRKLKAQLLEAEARAQKAESELAGTKLVLELSHESCSQHAEACRRLQDKVRRLVEALKSYAECGDGCTCGDGWSHASAKQALAGFEKENKQ